MQVNFFNFFHSFYRLPTWVSLLWFWSFWASIFVCLYFSIELIQLVFFHILMIILHWLFLAVHTFTSSHILINNLSFHSSTSFMTGRWYPIHTGPWCDANSRLIWYLISRIDIHCRCVFLIPNTDIFGWAVEIPRSY